MTPRMQRQRVLRFRSGGWRSHAPRRLVLRRPPHEAFKGQPGTMSMQDAQLRRFRRGIAPSLPPWTDVVEMHVWRRAGPRALGVWTGLAPCDGPGRCADIAPISERSRIPASLHLAGPMESASRLPPPSHSNRAARPVGIVPNASPLRTAMAVYAPMQPGRIDVDPWTDFTGVWRAALWDKRLVIPVGGRRAHDGWGGSADLRQTLSPPHPSAAASLAADTLR